MNTSRVIAYTIHVTALAKSNIFLWLEHVFFYAMVLFEDLKKTFIRMKCLLQKYKTGHNNKYYVTIYIIYKRISNNFSETWMKLLLMELKVLFFLSNLQGQV